MLPEKFEIHNMLYLKMKFLTPDIRGLQTILLSGAPRPLKGWETLFYTVIFEGTISRLLESLTLPPLENPV